MPEPGLDVEGARNAGYTEFEIRDALRAAKYPEDHIRDVLLTGGPAALAREAGHTDDDILQHLGLPLPERPSDTPAAPTFIPKPKQYEGAMRPVYLAGSELTGGMADALDYPGKAANLLFPESFPRTGHVRDLATAAGLTGREDLEPQPGMERIAGMAARGVGTALPLTLAGRWGGPAIASRLVPNVAAGGAGGAVAEAGHQLMPDEATLPLLLGAITAVAPQVLIHGALHRSPVAHRIEQQILGAVIGAGSGGGVGGALGVDPRMGEALATVAGAVLMPRLAGFPRAFARNPTPVVAGTLAGANTLTTEPGKSVPYVAPPEGYR